MITGEDIQKLKRIFATKDDLKKLENKVDDLIVDHVELKADVREMKENMATKTDLREIMTTLDGVMEELKAIREDNAIDSANHEEFRKQFDNHEKRIKKLESSTLIAH